MMILLAVTLGCICGYIVYGWLSIPAPRRSMTEDSTRASNVVFGKREGK